MSNEKYIVSKLDNKTHCVKNGQFSRHLRENGLTFQEYWECYITLVTPICPYCSSKVRFAQGQRTYAITCGKKECKNKMISETKQSWSEDQKKLDSENKKKALGRISETDKKNTLDKRKKTCLEKYGVEYTTQTEQMKIKSQETKLEKYGDAFYNNSEKSATKNRNKTAMEQDEINEKRRQTNQEKFGVDTPFMLPNTIQASMKSQAEGKQYTTPSGRVIGIRGYENLALDEVFSLYNEDDVYIDEVQENDNKLIFEYTNYNQHRWNYYPDICIKSKKLIIEVKSWWWYNGNGEEKYRGRYINNQRKAKACRDAGYEHQFWIYDKDGNRTII